jgi:hypothetical protein
MEGIAQEVRVGSSSSATLSRTKLNDIVRIDAPGALADATGGRDAPGALAETRGYVIRGDDGNGFLTVRLFVSEEDVLVSAERLRVEDERAEDKAAVHLGLGLSGGVISDKDVMSTRKLVDFALESLSRYCRELARVSDIAGPESAYPEAFKRARYETKTLLWDLAVKLRVGRGEAEKALAHGLMGSSSPSSLC